MFETYVHNIGCHKNFGTRMILKYIKKRKGRSICVVIRVSLQRVTKLINIENNNLIVIKDLSMDIK